MEGGVLGIIQIYRFKNVTEIIKCKTKQRWYNDKK